MCSVTKVNLFPKMIPTYKALVAWAWGKRLKPSPSAPIIFRFWSSCNVNNSRSLWKVIGLPRVVPNGQWVVSVEIGTWSRKKMLDVSTRSDTVPPGNRNGHVWKNDIILVGRWIRHIECTCQCWPRKKS